jgi:hypothetical protein
MIKYIVRSEIHDDVYVKIYKYNNYDQRKSIMLLKNLFQDNDIYLYNLFEHFYYIHFLFHYNISIL